MTKPRIWWASRRRRYNIGLIIAGLVAFACYAVVIETAPTDSLRGPAGEPPEITLFTIGLQGVGYLVAMAIANLLYGLGPVAEALVRPSDPAVFRTRLFRFGYAFSVALPFVVPVLVALKVVLGRDVH